MFQPAARFPVLRGDPVTCCRWLHRGQSCALGRGQNLRRKGADLDLSTVVISWTKVWPAANSGRSSQSSDRKRSAGRDAQPTRRGSQGSVLVYQVTMKYSEMVALCSQSCLQRYLEMLEDSVLTTWRGRVCSLHLGRGGRSRQCLSELSFLITRSTASAAQRRGLL